MYKLGDVILSGSYHFACLDDSADKCKLICITPGKEFCQKKNIKELENPAEVVGKTHDFSLLRRIVEKNGEDFRRLLEALTY